MSFFLCSDRCVLLYIPMSFVWANTMKSLKHISCSALHVLDYAFKVDQIKIELLWNAGSLDTVYISQMASQRLVHAILLQLRGELVTCSVSIPKTQAGYPPSPVHSFPALLLLA